MLKRGNKLSQQRHVALIQRLPFVIASLALLLVFAVLLFNKHRTPISSFHVTNTRWDSFQSLVQFNPTLEFKNGTDVIWQIPNSPKAVLFLAHGCSGRAVHFWDRSPNCPNCVGLPEERLIALHALSRKFAVITISSMGRCWTIGEERLVVKGIIEWWVKEKKLKKLPLFALGASSGGYFVSSLATNMRFSGITVMIASGLYDQMDVADGYPPVLFVHMPKDRVTKERIEENMDLLRKKGVDVAEVKSMEFPLSPYFLSDRIPGLDQIISSKLFELFKEKGFIDSKGYMKKDGRQTRWKGVLKEIKPLLPDKFELARHIQEEMNLAFALHEMTSLETDQIFGWFESHL
ncbi:hypothetical protein RJ641_015565 [Dillenia turbinata]|uniref:Uncharacterized protein n=1 Tax=Dillenia turbinata TaxID=194707 RepID=A0AAN8UXW1_9MAGN